MPDWFGGQGKPAIRPEDDRYGSIGGKGFYGGTGRADPGVCGVSLGFPSTIDRTRRHVLSTPNIPGLNDISVADFLEEKLQIPVFLERDVNLLLLHDLDRFGLLGEKTVIGIYFGTGIGNGIYINGRLLYGRNGVAGAACEKIPDCGTRRSEADSP